MKLREDDIFFLFPFFNFTRVMLALQAYTLVPPCSLCALWSFERHQCNEIYYGELRYSVMLWWRHIYFIS